MTANDAARAIVQQGAIHADGDAFASGDGAGIDEIDRRNRCALHPALNHAIIDGGPGSYTSAAQIIDETDVVEGADSAIIHEAAGDCQRHAIGLYRAAIGKDTFLIHAKAGAAAAYRLDQTRVGSRNEAQ